MISLEITKEDDLFKKEYDAAFEKVKGLLFLQSSSSATCSISATMEDKILEYFKLPISYLKEEEKHELPNVIIDDLELISKNETDQSTTSVYNYLLSSSTEQPPEWIIKEISKKYTTNIDFLNDTQTVIKTLDIPKKNEKENKINEERTEIKNIWKSLKNDNDFYDRYGYMDWEILKYLNENVYFLQYMAVVNILSPLMTLLFPIILFIIPFFILKIKGLSITFSTYIEVLLQIGKNHFIGKLLSTNVSFENIFYIAFLFFMFFMQIYQSFKHVVRFYQSISKVNNDIITIKNYVKNNIKLLELFVDTNKDVLTYKSFCNKTREKIIILQEMITEIDSISPFQISIMKFYDLGNILKCYYKLHDNINYEDAFLYLVGMKEYIHCLHGIQENFVSGKISFAEYLKEEEEEEDIIDKCNESDNESHVEPNTTMETAADTPPLQIINQYYAPHKNSKYVSNNCILDKNIIITGVNASGKTTFLKSTLINIIFSQQFGVGFYEKCIMRKPYTHLHSYLNIPDTMERDSLFQAEARRCKEILEKIIDCKKEELHFCIFDELYSGTNPIEATKTSQAFLKYLSTFKNVNFILTTHYNSICKKLQEDGRIKNCKTIVSRNEETDEFIYTYKIKNGICNIFGAKEVLKKMNYCNEILELL